MEKMESLIAKWRNSWLGQKEPQCHAGGDVQGGHGTTWASLGGPAASTPQSSKEGIVQGSALHEVTWGARGVPPSLHYYLHASAQRQEAGVEEMKNIYISGLEMPFSDLSLRTT